MSQFITRTPLGAVRALGSEAERSHARVTTIVARHVSPRHARVLADPVPVRDGTGIDWYADGDGTVVSLAALPAAEAAALRSQLAEMIRDVLDAADRMEQSPDSAQKHIPALLRQAFTFPGEENIWAVREEDTSLRPQLVAWGYEAHDAAAVTPFHVSKFARPRAHRLADQGGPANGAGAAGGAGSTVHHAPHGGAGGHADRNAVFVTAPVVAGVWRGAGWLYGLLFSLALLLLFALIVALLLPACGLRTPFGTIVFGLPGNVGCGRIETAAREPLIAAANLERELQVLREEHLRRQASCEVAQVPPPLDVQPETPPREETAMPAFEDVIDERGQYQVTLMWDTTDDLDLHIMCPNGERIYHYVKGQTVCGGVLDVDANVGTPVPGQPVENVTFHNGPSQGGAYRIVVNRHNDRSGAASVPYRVRIRTPSGSREVDGVATVTQQPQEVGSLTRE